MQTVINRIVGILSNIFRTFYWTKPLDAVTDIIDIIIVAFIFYHLIKLVRQTRAVLLLKGILVLIAAYIISSYFKLTVVNYIMNSLFQNSVLVLVIIFQPELRRVLEQTGRSTLSDINIFSDDDGVVNEQKLTSLAVNSICDMTADLQKQKMGALVVFERKTKLGEIADTGTTIDALPSRMLLGNIFFNKAPLHDGATIIREGRVLACGCILPLSEDTSLSLNLGTRHRAALGMSEVSDALVVVVSEETGSISLAIDGTLTRNMSKEALSKELEQLLVTDAVEAIEKKNEKRNEKKNKKSKSSSKDGENK